jgi:hypothetical protein
LSNCPQKYVSKRGAIVPRGCQFRYETEYKIYGDAIWGVTTHRVFVGGNELQLWYRNLEKNIDLEFGYLEVSIVRENSEPNWLAKTFFSSQPKLLSEKLCIWRPQGSDEYLDKTLTWSSVPIERQPDAVVAQQFVDACAKSIATHKAAIVAAISVFQKAEGAKANAEKERHLEAIRNLPRLPD